MKYFRKTYFYYFNYMYVLLNAVSVETYASGATWLGLTDGYEIPSVCCELNLSPSARRVQAFNV